MFDPELESFKNGIDLRAYAAGQGYQLDRKESWRGSRRHASPERRQDRHQARRRTATTSIFRCGRTTITARLSISCRTGNA